MPFLQESDQNPDLYISTSVNFQESPTVDDIYPNRLFFEYVLFLSPSMLFSLTAFYTIRKLNSNPSGYMGDLLQNSMFVKTRVCLLISITYALLLLIAILFPLEFYWIGEFPTLGFLYIFGIVAWYLNSKLIRHEAELGIAQGLHHKLFWTISLFFSLWRLFLPYERTFLPILINLIRCLSLLILTAYIFVKPYDSDTAENETEVGARGLALRNFLMRLESTKAVQTACAIKNYSPLKAPLLVRNSSHDNATKDYQEYLTKHKIKIFTREEAQKWLRDLSLLVCTVKQIRSKGLAGQIDIAYEVTTKVEDDKFIRIHKYADFLYLEEYISKRCDPSKAPWIDRETPELAKPDIKNFVDNEEFVRARNNALERYLAVLTADPRYMIESVIEFLGIESPYREAYLGYNGYLKNTSHKEKLAKRFQKDIQEIEMKRFDKLKPKRHSSYGVPDDLPFFSCFCKSYQKAELQSHYEYVFVVTDQNDPTKVAWTITKTFKDFKDFHEKLETVMNGKMPIFERLVPKVTDQKQTDDLLFIEKRKEGLEKYLNHILKNRSNYKDVLYEFLEYHNAARKDSSKNVTPRSSFFETSKA